MASQRWVITDIRGVPIRTLYTKGWHPCHERGEAASNVMRTHAVDEGLWADACVFKTGEPVLSEAAAEVIAHRTILARFADPIEMMRALAFGLSDDERAQLQKALAWNSSQTATA